MIGILLVNLGTPEKPSNAAIRRYLREFLSDERVLDINPLARWLLVNLIIVPFRSPKSRKAYEKIWTAEGSPLLKNTRDLTQAVARELGKNYQVEFAMRYGAPSLESALRRFQENRVESIRILPLYPQYASSSTGSTQEKIHALAKKIPDLPPIQFLLPFFEHPGYAESFAEIGRPMLEAMKPDHILFSFHGLPERQILKEDIGGKRCLKSENCCEEIVPANGLCYRAHCFHSTYAIAERLGLKKEDYTICFQSRLGRTPWIKPYTDIVIDELAKNGKKRLAVFCPAFVADCLETLEEIGMRAKEQFIQAGGEDLKLIPSLNAHPTWVTALVQMLQGKS